MKKKLILTISGVGLVIIVIVIGALFFIFSNNPTTNQNLSLYQATIFLDKFNSTPFTYTLGTSLSSSNLIQTSSLPLYKYSLTNTIDLVSLFKNKYKITSTDKVISYNIDKTTSLYITSNFVKISFNITKQSDVFGFKSADINMKKAFDYLNTQNIVLDPANYLFHENFYSTGAGEFSPSSKTSADIQSIVVFPKVKEFSYIYNSHVGIMNFTFNKANDLLSVTINTPTLSTYQVDSTTETLNYLDITNNVLTTDNIKKNGLFFPNYSTGANILLNNIEYVYLPSKDNYLIPFIRLSDSSGINEVLVPIVDSKQIVYGS